ncbi:hypothetical protein [Candidatus Thioglobus autotrophicus]|jgi:hypothetical protein|uniref:hypothetical protein n=1 Tax=Candidatus Thioglobus autotrophicus TaxID=1705394 RepID=UPI00299DEBAB|nr:hypothetical protein [Candidatus Thioglobus autotrophicus]WPE18719.1 hypothetical protein R5P05_03680 [Candidatus Thioglobus autotrophicus]
MQQVKEINITLDVVLSVPASSNEQAYETLDKMDILKQIQRLIERHQFIDLNTQTKH